MPPKSQSKKAIKEQRAKEKAYKEDKEDHERYARSKGLGRVRGVGTGFLDKIPKKPKPKRKRYLMPERARLDGVDMQGRPLKSGNSKSKQSKPPANDNQESPANGKQENVTIVPRRDEPTIVPRRREHDNFDISVMDDGGREQQDEVLGQEERGASVDDDPESAPLVNVASLPETSLPELPQVTLLGR